MSTPKAVARSTLTEVSTTTLERLRDAIESGKLTSPIRRPALVAFGIRNQLDAIDAALTGHPRLACLSILDVTLAERKENARPAPELVWTGPEGHGATARDTAVVLRELFKSAREHVILGGCYFTNAGTVLRPLYDAMVEHGAKATFFVNVASPDKASDPPEKHAQDAMAAFLADNWPFGPPYPTLYCDNRVIDPNHNTLLHAKCVVVDGKRAFVSSANFTFSGQERNIEVGVLLDDPMFSRHLASQWMSLVGAGLTLKYTGPGQEK